jgi:ABC-type branched-subunit amino acid transport system substrate-binding protein
MKGRKRIALLCFLALLLVVVPLLAAACGGDDEDETPKPAEDEIVIGMTLGLSGPAASAYGPGFSFLLGTFRYINEVLGGIEGFKIKFVWADNKYDAATAVVAFKRLRDKHHPMMWWAFEDFAYTGVEDILERDKTPVFSYGALEPRVYDAPGMIFALFGSDANLFTGAVRWVLQDWKASGGTGRPKLGTLHWDSDWGNGHKVGSTYQWAEEHGVDIVERTYPMMSLDLRPQLMALRDEGVNYIWFGAVTTEAVLVIRDARALGLWDRVKFIRGYSGEPYDVLAIVGEGAEGLYEVTEMEPHSSDVEAVRVQDAIREWATGETTPRDMIMTPVSIEVLKALVRQAIEDVGRENLTGEALYNAFQKLENINTMGAFHSDLSWGSERRIANRFMKIKQYTKTSTVAVSDWIPMDNVFEREARGKWVWPPAD